MKKTERARVGELTCEICGHPAKEVREATQKDGLKSRSFLHGDLWMGGDYHFKWLNLWPEADDGYDEASNPSNGWEAPV